LRWSQIFVLYFVYVNYYVYWYVYGKPSLRPWHETNLIMVYNLFSVLLNSVYKYFENFCICVHQSL
jgi:hypothetical protein